MTTRGETNLTEGELVGDVFSEWMRDNGVLVDYIEPGKPNQNAYIERFNRDYRTEALNLYLFRNLREVRGDYQPVDSSSQTRTYPTTHWAVSGRLCTPTESWKTLLLNCRLDGEKNERLIATPKMKTNPSAVTPAGRRVECASTNVGRRVHHLTRL